MVETRLVGIVNVTPDSFSDGGEHYTPAAALAAIERAIEDGAHVVDIGAESTRPGAAPLDAEEEWARLKPVLRELKRFEGARIPFSLDTRHGVTAGRGLDHGISWINDVSGFSDPAMVKAVTGSQCVLVVMHSLSVPADSSVVMNEGTDVVGDIMVFANARIAQLVDAGIERERIVFDPGVGFGKTALQSLAIVEHITPFKELGVPLLVGHSRKSFLTAYAGGVYKDKGEATLAVSKLLAEAGVEYLRVHDVAAHIQFLGLHKAHHHE